MCKVPNIDIFMKSMQYSISNQCTVPISDFIITKSSLKIEILLDTIPNPYYSQQTAQISVTTLPVSTLLWILASPIPTPPQTLSISP